MVINLSGIDFSGNGGSGGGSYTLPTASENVLGGVKIGSGITIDENGAISAEGGGANDYYVGWDDLFDMDYGPRRAAFAEIVEKYNAGYHIYASGTTAASNGYDVILPLVEFIPGTWSTDRYIGGWAKFGAINNSGQTSGYYGATFNSSGNITPNSKYFARSNFYTLPNATVSHLGGVIVGSGLTIDSNGVLSVSGGSAQSDYLIVDALSDVTNPQEGQMAQVRTEAETTEYQKLYVTDASTAPLSEGYWGVLRIDGVGNRPVYISGYGEKFFWNWPDGDSENPIEWTEGEWEGRTYQYKCDFSGEYPEFQIIFPEGSDIYLTTQWEDAGNLYNVNGISTGTGTETVYKYSSPYIYQGGKWASLMKTYLRSDILEFTTSAETAEIVGEMKAAVEAGRAPFIIDNEHNLTLAVDSVGDDYVTFNGEKNGTTYYISLSDTRHEQDEYDSRGIKTWENYWVPSPEYVSAYFRVNTAGTIYDCEGREHYVSFDDEFPRILLLYQGGDGYPPQSEAYVEWRTAYKALNGDNEEKWYYVFGGKVGIGTTIYNGVWGCLQDDWTIETLSWTSGATYESQNYPPYTGSTS